MSPLDVLGENFNNVVRTLNETLRYDFVPQRSREYFDECEARLGNLKPTLAALSSADVDGILRVGYELDAIAQWISLIERSHLGEFSWPFSEELRRLSAHLLYEHNLKGERVDPIVHVIAVGSGYQITYELVPSPSSGSRFVIVAFPRSLKHHVLLHSIFGHELCHTAIYTSATGNQLQADVIPHLVSAGPLRDSAALNAWVMSSAAPSEVQAGIAAYVARGGIAEITERFRESWWVELVCDLFGLVLFGPAFLAAHKAILGGADASPYNIPWDYPSHPPYAVRQKMLVRAMRILGWNKPIAPMMWGATHNAEQVFLSEVLADPFDPWADLFGDAQLKAAIAGIQAIWAASPDVGYKPTSPSRLEALLNNISRGLPPLITHISKTGVAKLEPLSVSEILYAGWVYWHGKEKLRRSQTLSYLQTNRLCDLALLQQRAVDMAIAAGTP